MSTTPDQDRIPQKPAEDTHHTLPARAIGELASSSLTHSLQAFLKGYAELGARMAGPGKDLSSLISKSMVPPAPGIAQAALNDLNAIERVGGMDMAKEITGKAPRTIYNLVSQGKLPAYKSGNKLLFSESALLEYARKPRVVTARRVSL